MSSRAIAALLVGAMPARGLWLGVVPVEPGYASETGTWSMDSGVEVTGEL